MRNLYWRKLLYILQNIFIITKESCEIIDRLNDAHAKCRVINMEVDIIDTINNVIGDILELASNGFEKGSEVMSMGM